MRLRIDLKIFLLLFLFFITNQIKIYAIIMIFAIMHEFGHLLIGILLGMKIEKLEIKLSGISVEFKVTNRDYNKKIKNGNLLELKKILIASAGPITNIILIIILKLFNMSDYDDRMLMIFSNIVLILFNILPIYPLDGGRILKSIIHIVSGKSKAEMYIHHISYITLVILTAVSSISILYLKNIAIFIAIIFLWILLIKEEEIYKNKKKMYEILEQEIGEYEKNYNLTIENKLN